MRVLSLYAHNCYSKPLFTKCIVLTLDHLTVVGLVTWLLHGTEAGVYLVLMQTSLFLSCLSHAGQNYWMLIGWDRGHFFLIKRALLVIRGTITWCWLAEHACIKLVSRFKRILKRNFRDASLLSLILTRARGADFQVGGLTRTRKREPTRGIRGHAPPGKFEILFFWNG